MRRIPDSGGIFLSARRQLTLVLAFAGALFVVAPAMAGGGPHAQPPTDQILVRLAAGASFDASALDATAGVKLKHVRRLSDGTYVLKLPARLGSDGVQAISDRLAARGDVLSAGPDALMQPLSVPTDPSWGQQWDMFAPSSGNYGIDLAGARDITLGSSGITIGVIDTGYRPHVDLAGRFVGGYDFIGDTLVANDGNGRDSDAGDPGDWISSAENASGYFAGCGVSNSSWHGTHVSGTIGAVSDNGIGVAGINQGSKIQPLRVLGKCGGYTSDIADAIRWAAGLSVNGIPNNPTPDRVVNISLGGSGGCDSTTQNAINAAVAAGTVVVVAAGNSNANAANFTPANCANVITVAATGYTGQRAYYSNYGSSVEIAAPGGDAQLGKTILSTLNAGATTPGADSYANYQGTSMATPHVVGVVSLMLSVNPGLTPAQVTAMLQATATKFPTGSTCITLPCGAGIVNAAAAVAAANGGGGTPPPGSFSKTSPADLASIAGTSTTLTWGASPDATTYSYCVDTVNNGSCDSSWQSAGAATSVGVSGLAAGTAYYWQVQASNATGNTLANGGTWWTFATQAGPAKPGAFSKTSPTNGQPNQKQPITLRWAASSGATSYEWCVSVTSGTCSSWRPATSTSASVTGLTSKKAYFWQVRAVNGLGTTDANGGAWWSFRTK
jgi:serine protease